MNKSNSLSNFCLNSFIFIIAFAFCFNLSAQNKDEKVKKTDPVLAYAAIKFGAVITPEQAGSYYFMVEKTEDEDEAETK